MVQDADKRRVVGDNCIGSGSKKKVQCFMLPSTQVPLSLKEGCCPWVPGPGARHVGAQCLANRQSIGVTELDAPLHGLGIHSAGDQAFPGPDQHPQDAGLGQLDEPVRVEHDLERHEVFHILQHGESTRQKWV